MLIPIRGIARNGLQLDPLQFEIPANGFTDGDNIHIRDGSIIRTEGSTYFFQIPHAIRLFNWESRAGRKIVAIIVENGTTKVKIYSTTVSNPVDVTPTSAITGSDWNITQHGDFLIMAMDGQTPHFLASNGVHFAPLPGWGDITDNGQSGGTKITAYAGIIMSYKNHLIAFRAQLSGNDNPFNILWSDPLPSDEITSSWMYGAIDTTSGLDYAPAAQGEIITALELNSAVMLYQRGGISRMQYVGAPNIYDVRAVETERGLVNKNAVASMRGVHYCVDDIKIYSFDGQRPRYIADDVTQNWFNEYRGDPEKISVVAIPAQNEVWFIFADNQSTKPNRALVYNPVLDVWTKRFLPAEEDINSDGTLSPLVISQVINAPMLPRSSATYDTIGTTHDEESRTYADLETTQGAKNELLYMTATGRIYQAVNGYKHLPGVNEDAVLMQQALDLESLLGNSVRLKTINALYPQVDGVGDLEIVVGGHNTPTGSIEWGYPQSFTIGTDVKVDLRGTYRYLSVKITQSGTGYFRISGWDLDLTVGGLR